MANNVDKSTEWNMSTDIYDIVGTLNSLKQRYIEDEDETTLALGVFGYITDVEAKKIQTSTIMTGQLGNEMFPTRANLTKNVLTHAIYSNIEDINATPSKIIINMGIKVQDFNNNLTNNRFIFDRYCPIFIGEYEFHFDYDIILIRSISSSGSYVYSAHYDTTIKNRLSDVTDPYLKQPFIVHIGNYDYIVFQCTIRQLSIETTKDKIITDSIIANKTYTFTFDNQLSDFDVIINDNNEEIRLTPLPYGTSTNNIDKYCWYLFISDNTVRITFDSKSYIPRLNSNITIEAYTTLGAKGIFNYTKIDESSDGFYIDFNSDKYNYEKLTCYMVAVTNSIDGTDRKSKEELQKLIPKAALSRGSITTETDVTNYFNLIDSEDNRLMLQKKTDNQLERIWYAYFLLKDEMYNIIPTNTIFCEFDTDSNFIKTTDDDRYVLPAGSIIKYNADTKVGKVIDESDVPELFTDAYFSNDYYYMTIYNLVVTPDPLFASFYMSVSNKDSYFIFNWLNENSDLQFVATKCNFKRNLLTDQNIYKLSFKIGQSISSDYGMYYEEIVEEVDGLGNKYLKTIVTNNMKCILVLYSDDTPYRWTEANLVSFTQEGYRSEWEIQIETDNELDQKNKLKIKNMHVAGYNDSVYGYVDANTKAMIYVLAKFDYNNYGRYDLDKIAPGYEEYSVTNIYEINNGLDFYENYTNVMDTRVYKEKNNSYKVSGIPVVGLHYMISEDNANYLVEAMSNKKAYIDYCLRLLENSLNIDFKFFNTYGPASTYTIGDRENTLIGHLDLEMKFRVAVKSSSDTYTKADIITAIKEYFENLQEIGDWHAPTMITELTNKFENRINFIEFMNYNNFRLGVQHITKLDVEDINTAPEFLNIRNRYNIEGTLEPCIDVEILY